MKKTTANDLKKTYSGIFGNQVILKNRKGKTVMTIMPPKPPVKPTINQDIARDRFRRASNFATNILKDPEMLAAYRAKAHNGLTAYNVALRDFFSPPFISKIDASVYHGKPGGKISVTAGDDFKVAGVTVQILSPAGIMIEEGACGFTLPEGTYDYTTTIAVPDLTGITIIARSCDIPGNITRSAISL
jgi:hypothetical protein